MFWSLLIISIVCLVIAIALCAYMVRCGKKVYSYGHVSNFYEKDKFGYASLPFWIAFAVLLLIAFTGLSTYSNHIGDFNTLDRLNTTCSIKLDRANDIEAKVIAELRKYPEHEKEVFGNINPEILLSYPELNANETIAQGAKEYKGVIDSLAKLDGRRADVLQRILDRETQITIFWPATPSYQERFGEVNPLVSNKMDRCKLPTKE